MDTSTNRLLTSNPFPQPDDNYSINQIGTVFLFFHINSHIDISYLSYHKSMKKIPLFLLLPFLLTSCNDKTYSLKEIVGFETSDITGMQVSSSVYQSLAWFVDEKYYSYLDCSYVLVNFDVDEQFMGWPPNESKDDAICVRVAAESSHPYDMWYSAIFYISHKSHYMYIRSIEEGKSFRSVNVMPNQFIIEITSWN